MIRITGQPSRIPSSQPSRQPFMRPSSQPTRQPTAQPSRQPFGFPTMQPSRQPSCQPSQKPSTMSPTGQPTQRPSSQPSRQPTMQPSRQPFMRPTGSKNCMYNISTLLHVFLPCSFHTKRYPHTGVTLTLSPHKTNSIVFLIIPYLHYFTLVLALWIYCDAHLYQTITPFLHHHSLSFFHPTSYIAS